MHRRIVSFKNAFKGLNYAFNTQVHFKVHLVAGVLVCALAYFLQISLTEFLIILMFIFGVLVAELFNTSVEAATDAHKVIKKTKEEDRLIGVAKDVAAAAVLMMSLGAVVAGILVFLPHLM